MKKVLIASGVAVLAVAMLAGAQGYAFNTNLTVGSTGSDVVALQTWLMANGYNIPALASGAASKGYFGSQTKAAVMAYQAANGIPNTGFVGPLTRGALNSGGAVSVAACPIAGWTSVVYQGVNVCLPPGYTLPGATQTTTVTTVASGNITTPGAEGLITTKLASNPIADANIRVASNVPVYGIEVKAQGSDMILDRVLLQMQVGVGGAATSVSNPATFVKKLYAYDGSTLLKSWDLGAADFNKDSSDRYYVIASGLRFVIPKDTTKVLTFKVDTIGVSSDQSSRYLTVQGYAGNTQNVRAVDGAGSNSYTDMSGTANSRVQVFTTSGTSALTVTLNSSLTPKSTNNKVDSSDGIKNLTMMTFDIKSTTGASVIKSVYVNANATSSEGMPSTLYLYDGSTVLASASASAQNSAVGFTDLTLPIGKDETKTLIVKADFASTVSGQAASTSIPATGIKFEKPDSTTASSTNTAFAGNDQYLWSAAPQWVLVGTPTSVATVGVKDVASSSVSGTIVIKGTAFGGSMTKPVAADFTTVFASSTATSYSSANSVTGGNKVVTVSPSDATVGDGGSYTVTITDTVYSSDTELAYGSQPLFMAISAIDSTVGTNTITNQTWGIDTFYTTSQQLTRSTY